MGAIQAKDRLIVALDVKDIAAARDVVKQLDGVADFFKSGHLRCNWQRAWKTSFAS